MWLPTQLLVLKALPDGCNGKLLFNEHCPRTFQCLYWTISQQLVVCRQLKLSWTLFNTDAPGVPFGFFKLIDSHNNRIQLTERETGVIVFLKMLQDVLLGQNKRIRRYDITGGGYPNIFLSVLRKSREWPEGQWGVQTPQTPTRPHHDLLDCLHGSVDWTGLIMLVGLFLVHFFV